MVSACCVFTGEIVQSRRVRGSCLLSQCSACARATAWTSPFPSPNELSLQLVPLYSRFSFDGFPDHFDSEVLGVSTFFLGGGEEPALSLPGLVPSTNTDMKDSLV